jgi:hypothetical protein
VKRTGKTITAEQLETISDEIWDILERHGVDSYDMLALLGCMIQAHLRGAPDPAAMTRLFVAGLEENMGVAGAPGA